ncbi:MAG: hypothetical protein V2I35_11180, partial [Desulfocapsaceae bacterium]|nr:hypothetical protein [Desulfocapsaceae bacterium]
ADSKYLDGKPIRQSKIILLNQLLGATAMIGTTVFASTGLLVSAGFTFNEVFYYRFPNFDFAFIVLICALALHLFSKMTRNSILACAVFCSLSGLTGLIAYGLVSSAPIPFQQVNENSSILGLLPLLLVFTGIDQARIIARREAGYFIVAFLFLVVVLAGWMFISAGFVEADRLLHSTIPYMTAAGKIAGNTGRLVMGMVIISGSLLAVYGLLSICSSFFIRTTKYTQGGNVHRIVIVLLAAAVGIMMATGVAGSSSLELYIRSSLLLWLIHMAFSVLSGAFSVRVEKPLQAAAGILSSIVIFSCSLTLFFFQKEVPAAALFVASMIAVTAVLMGIVKFITTGHGSDKSTRRKITEV